MFNKIEMSEIPEGQWIRDFQKKLSKAVERLEVNRGIHVKDRFRKFDYGRKEDC